MIKALLHGLAGTGMLAILAAGYAEAEVYNTTGDLNIGPVMDVTQPTIMCNTADPLFRMFEMRAMSQQAKIEPYMKSTFKNGQCREVPASSVFVVGIKMTKIRASKDAAPSIYTVARVKLGGQFFYTLPNHLMESSFDIIKQSQLANKEMGYELVQ